MTEKENQKIMENNEIMNFGKIIEDLIEYNKNTVTKPKNKRKYKYNGYDTTHSSICACSPSVKQWLSKDEYEYQLGKGKKGIEILLTCAVQLGIQQGINMCKKNPFHLI